MRSVIQTIILSSVNLRKHRHLALVVVVGFCLGFLLISVPAPPDRMLNIQNYLITVGGIISAFVIAYLSTKVFDVRRERSIIKAELDVLSDKLTLFRKLLFYVMKSRDFWVKYDDIAKFKQRFPDLDYQRLHTMETDPLRQSFWDTGSDLSHNTIELWLAMEAITGKLGEHGQIPWIYDPNASFNYSLEQIGRCYEPSNQIWYLLEGRFAKHGYGRFNDTGIWVGFESDARDCISRIDERLKGKDFHREILGGLASDFHEVYLPRMHVLIRDNIGVPKVLSASFRSLFVIMLFGVLLPIVLQSISVPDIANVGLTLFFVWVTSLALLTFMLEFYRFLNADTAVIKQE